MPGLLSNSPYAGFDPKKDPYLLRNPPRDPSQVDTTGQLLKGQVAGLLGFPGDIMQTMVDVQAGANHVLPRQLPFTSNRIGGLLGANPQSRDFRAGLLGAPDPSDIAKIAGKGLLAQALFHGTPHRFDKFDLKAIGTGEGAQAYGHGLYFAESPGVAKSYQTTGAGRIARYENRLSPNAEFAADFIEQGMKETEILDMFAKSGRSDFDGAMAAIKEAKDAGVSRGHLYEVDIPDETIGKMLDYDRPFNKQPKEIKGALMDALRDVFKREGFLGPNDNGPRQFTSALKSYRIERGGFIDGDTGGSYYGLLANALGSPEAASKKLNELGVPGIRFLDGGSRAANRGTRNIVVFNPDDIREVKRDGELVYKTQGL